CHQPPKTGPCRAHVKRYYYDQMEKTCKQFIYGGCDGNENNFKTKEECERTCQSVCELPPDRGPCRGHMLRYYYDQNAKTCKEFIYGGCQGNGNNFLTKKECERTCKSVGDSVVSTSEEEKKEQDGEDRATASKRVAEDSGGARQKNRTPGEEAGEREKKRTLGEEAGEREKKQTLGGESGEVGRIPLKSEEDPEVGRRPPEMPNKLLLKPV
ncbi:hypothetical protein AB205_0003040, partial [Aquarana catesbeiana]